MGIERFIKNVVDMLELDDFSEQKKKKAIKKLLKKLERRKAKVKNHLEKHLNDREKKETKEELQLIRYNIKKGKKLLEKLEKNN